MSRFGEFRTSGGGPLTSFDQQSVVLGCVGGLTRHLGCVGGTIDAIEAFGIELEVNLVLSERFLGAAHIKQHVGKHLAGWGGGLFGTDGILVIGDFAKGGDCLFVFALSMEEPCLGFLL